TLSRVHCGHLVLLSWIWPRQSPREPWRAASHDVPRRRGPPGCPSPRSRRQHDRAEVGGGVERVQPLPALQEVDHHVGQRRGNYFIEYLKRPLDENGCQQLLGLEDAGDAEGKSDEDERIGTLANERRANGTRPQPTAACGDLHLRQDKRI